MAAAAQWALTRLSLVALRARAAQVDFYVNCKLEKSAIPFRRPTSAYIGACALGNRDRCTTWFDSFAFTQEEELSHTQLPLIDGCASGWCVPMVGEGELFLHAAFEHGRPPDARGGRADSGSHDAQLHVSAPGAFIRHGPFTPLSAREVAQRHALNKGALSQMRTMLADDSTADVVLKVEGERIYAHRCVLVARCETFRAMLSSGLAEGRPAAGDGDGEDGGGGNGTAGARAAGAADAERLPSARAPLWTITVKETEPAVFRKMLDYLYAGAIEVEADIAPGLLALADQYMLPGLKLICGFALRKSITTETVCRIYQSADRFDCEGSELKQQCLAFILANYDAIVKTDHWEELTASPHLLVEVTRAVASSRKDSSSPPPLKRKRIAD